MSKIDSDCQERGCDSPWRYYIEVRDLLTQTYARGHYCEKHALLALELHRQLVSEK